MIIARLRLCRISRGKVGQLFGEDIEHEDKIVKASYHPTNWTSLYLELAWSSKKLKYARKTKGSYSIQPPIAVELLVTLIIYRVLGFIQSDVTVTAIADLTILPLKRDVRYSTRKLSRLLNKQKATFKGCG